MRLQQVKNQLQQQICGDYHQVTFICIIWVPVWVWWKLIRWRLINCALHLADSAMYQDKKRQDKTFCRTLSPAMLARL